MALYKITQEYAAGLGLSLEGPLATICERAEINRTQVYERKKQLEEALANITLAGPGHPIVAPVVVRAQDCWRMSEQVLLYRLAHPGALVSHENGRATYSDGFIRFILDLLDEWEGTLKQYGELVMVPEQTLIGWRKRDREQAYARRQHTPCPRIPSDASTVTRQIALDYSTWDGSLRDFFSYASTRLHLGPTPVRRVLVILGLLPLRGAKGPRYRGELQRCQPGSILVTDGKTVTAICTGSGEVLNYNWQGMIDQATTCHTAVVVTDTESAEGVREAYDQSCKFLGRPPLALVHDNKPIHDDRKLRGHIEKTTTMIPDPEQDREFIAQLHADHTRKPRVDHLPTHLVSRYLLDEGFARFGIAGLDPKGNIRAWLAGAYTPEAIRQGLAIFGTEREKGRLLNKTSHRYLVKVIQNCQQELDLRRQEELLREYAQLEQSGWLQELETEYERLAKECVGYVQGKELAFQLCERAAFGGLILHRAFWENKLKAFLASEKNHFAAVYRHVRRLFETTWENRFALMSKLVAWEYQLAH